MEAADRDAPMGRKNKGETDRGLPASRGGPQGAACEPQPFEFGGKVYKPGANSHWKPCYPAGLERLAAASRIHVAANSIQYWRFACDFPYSGSSSGRTTRTASSRCGSPPSCASPPDHPPSAFPIKQALPEKEKMAIIIGWKDTEGRKCPERLDIDPDHLDADEIKNLKKTKQWFPDVKEFVPWKVKCSLEERDNGDREIGGQVHTEPTGRREPIEIYRTVWKSILLWKKQDYCRARSENRSIAPEGYLQVEG